ncbi:hypothetical protein RR48_11061 [Papilio machaon]|uniref:Uncharacterized protein n=1 Tax=Papilio machaon TaxID=76193 RepID=A0A194RPV3_PAPMA|nr:hypothetical protein RR48_11061 [Papilio machaon]
MSEEDIPLITFAGTSKKYTELVNKDDESVTQDSIIKRNNKKSLLRRLKSIRSIWKFGKVRNRLRNISCLMGSEEEEMEMMEVPRHRSIDIGVGLARRISLFIFTRRSVCVHPYHPYTPAQTTRKIYFNMDDR